MTTTFSIDYERLVDGEFEPDTKKFTDKDEALNFAADKCKHVDYSVEDETENFKQIDFGFVNAETGELVSQKSEKTERIKWEDI